MTPTPGRVMWFYEDPRCGQSNFTSPRYGEPLAAIVASVRPADDLRLMVNLSVFDADGKQHPRQNVVVVQDGEEIPDCAYVCWMPYQIGQAKKHQENASGLSG
jgi:hypothetical protein